MNNIKLKDATGIDKEYNDVVKVLLRNTDNELLEFYKPEGSETIRNNGTFNIADKREVIVAVPDLLEYVDALPTENINVDKVYAKKKFNDIGQVTTASGETLIITFKEAGEALTDVNYKFFQVSTRPTENIWIFSSSDKERNYYYVENEDKILMYTKGDNGFEWVELETYLGKVDDISEVTSTTSGYYAIMGDYAYYRYINNTWVRYIAPEGKANLKKSGSYDVTEIATVEVFQPTLNDVTISLSGNILTITPNSNNGNFVSSYDIYADNVLVGNSETTTVDLSTLITALDEYTIKVKAIAEYFNPSSSNTVRYNNMPTLATPDIEIMGDYLNIYDEGLATSYDIVVDGEVKATIEKDGD